MERMCKCGMLLVIVKTLHHFLFIEHIQVSMMTLFPLTGPLTPGKYCIGCFKIIIVNLFGKVNYLVIH